MVVAMPVLALLAEEQVLARQALERSLERLFLLRLEANLAQDDG